MTEKPMGFDPRNLPPALQAEGLTDAYQVVRQVFPPTPLVESIALSTLLKRSVWLKLETVTPIRAFKVRGALVKAADLEAQGEAGGLVTASAGNHGLAVAYAGRRLGCPVTVFVPEQANAVKVAGIKALGADVRRGGRTYRELSGQAIPFAEQTGAVWVHPFDDPRVIAGQATVGVEIVEALPEVTQVVVPMGGGGLAAGIAVSLLAKAPGCALVGVQMSGADAMLRSIAAKRVVTLDRVDTVADGLAPGTVTERTLAIVGGTAESLVRLEDHELFVAMRFLLERERILAEPSGAAGVAALLRGEVPGTGPVAVVVTGANVTMEHLAVVMATSLPDTLAAV